MNKVFKKNVLKGGINRMLNDKVKFLSKETLLWCTHNVLDTEVINALKDWEKRGILKILKNPNTCDNDEICIEMLKYIDKESPIPNWP